MTRKSPQRRSATTVFILSSWAATTTEGEASDVAVAAATDAAVDAATDTVDAVTDIAAATSKLKLLLLLLLSLLLRPIDAWI